MVMFIAPGVSCHILSSAFWCWGISGASTYCTTGLNMVHHYLPWVPFFVCLITAPPVPVWSNQIFLSPHLLSRIRTLYRCTRPGVPLKASVTRLLYNGNDEYDKRLHRRGGGIIWYEGRVYDLEFLTSVTTVTRFISRVHGMSPIFRNSIPKWTAHFECFAYRDACADPLF